MLTFRRATGIVLAALTFGVVLFLALPLTDLTGQVFYDVIAACSITTGFVAVAHYRPARPGGWLLVLSGMGIWVIGDVVWSIEQFGYDSDAFPAPSDAVYLSGYLALAAGAFLMVRSRRSSRDATGLLDSLIVAAGVAVLVTTFVIAPLAADSTSTVAAKVVSSIYPIADLLLLAILARLWTIPGARTVASTLLSASVGLTLVVDLVWNVWTISTNSTSGAGGHLADTAWLTSYVLVAAAACAPSMRALSEPLPDREVTIPSSRRLVALAAGLTLPAIALLIDGVLGNVSQLWPVIGIGMLLLTGLILARMSGLLRVVQNQAMRLEAVARSDSLTGAPNRRTWDHELTRNAELATEHGTQLCVGMLDLDSFKAYNDTHGHQAGDLLLREAVAAWTDALGSKAMVARYGGEEFAVLLPRMSLLEAKRTIDALRTLTPSDQTFSAGVAMWDPMTEPSTAVAWADEALYQAKRTGRDRVVAHNAVAETSGANNQLPSFTVVLQPIVRLADGVVVAHEALSRFYDANDDIASVFARAHAHGYGDLLEVAAINAALAVPDRPMYQDLYVNASPTALAAERFWSWLPSRLDRVVVEISELRDGVDESVLVGAVERLRARGARIALDDLGSKDGSREFARLAALRPDVVKIDRSIVSGCAVSPDQAALLSALAAYSSELGVVVCAEGVEDERDLRRLTDLGITHAQGFLLARPDEKWRESVAVHSAGATRAL